jgi:two-component system sensor histidine kinase HydH
MKKNELKIINSILTGNRLQTTPRQALENITAAVFRHAMAGRAALYLSEPDGALTLTAESRQADLAPSPASLAPGSPVAVLLPGLEDARRMTGPVSGLAPPWEGAPSVVLVPFSAAGRGALLAVIGREGDRLAGLGLPFFTLLGETIGLVVEDISTHRSLEARIGELSVLHEIGRTTGETLDLAGTLPRITRIMVEALGGRAGRITFRLPPSVGVPAMRHTWPEGAGEGPTGEALDAVIADINAGGGIRLDAPRDLPGDPPSGGRRVWVSAFPLICHQEIIGGAAVVRDSPLTEADLPFPARDPAEFLSALSAQISLSTAESLHFAESRALAGDNEDRAHELSILFEISQVLAGTMRLDDVLKVIMTASTYGHGLGFNRAALFLMNDKTQVLQGMMGVGPDSSEEAHRIWGDLSAKGWDLGEVLRLSLRSAIANPLDTIVKGIRLAVNPEAGILARTVIERRSFNVPDASARSPASRSVADRLGTRAFATAPMIADGRVLGVILVDNLFNNRPITEDDLRLLGTFANQAALAINNAQLYNRLEKANMEVKTMYGRIRQSERLATLGEMAATVAHEVRNPLVSMGGFTRRLERRMDKDDPNRRYTGIIIKETARLERFLDEILAFSRELAPTFSEVDLNRLITDLADFYAEELKSKKIVLELNLADDTPSIQADPEQISQIFMNFFNNSIEALPGGGTIAVTTASPAGDGYVHLTFRDTGGGIPESVIPDIFKPFFTTKSKGTGLGLPLAHKMIKNHRGTVEIDNRPGESITFLVKLPVRQAVSP